MNLALASQPRLSHSAIYRQRRARGIYPRPRFSLNEADLEKLYLHEKKSLKEISDLLGCSRDTITDWLRYFKIPVRTASEGIRLAAEKGKLVNRKGRGFWKGGRRLENGYVYVYSPNHPRANRDKCVPEHLLVWEATHQQPLPEGWIIHHLNGDRADNHPENLVASPSRNHYDFISALTKRIKYLESEIERLKNEKTAEAAKPQQS